MIDDDCIHTTPDWIDGLIEAGEKSQCKGLFFRCRVSMFCRPGNRAYVQTVELIPLKRKSCTGCNRCENLHEFIRECGGDFVLNGWEDGALYELKVTNYHRDYYGEEDYDVEFVLVEEPVHG